MEKYSERMANAIEDCVNAWSQVQEEAIKKGLERLAAYEDTGLEPEEIVRMGMAYQDSKRYSGRLELKLKPYLDIGLSPSELNALKLASMGKCVVEIKEFDGIAIDRLRELAQAEKDGLLVVRPQEAEKNESLTLDELREMDGEPVWVVLGQRASWCIVDAQCEAVFGKCCGCTFQEIGRHGAVYRRKPEEAQE